VIVAERVEKRPDLQIREQRVSEVDLPVDLVAVAAALFDPHDEALRHKVGNDLLRGPFADSDVPGDVTDPDHGVASDTEQHVAVVRQHEPRRLGGVAFIYGWLLNHGS
jgi:hypothetical protein